MTTKIKKVRSTLTIVFLLLIVLALGFTGILNINSFQQNYTESLVSSYAVVGRETVRKIEYAEKYGKPLDNFLGIEELLGEVKTELPEVDNVYIVLRDGSYVYDIHGTVREEQRPIYELTIAPKFNAYSSDSYQMVLEDQKYHLMLPIKDKEGNPIGNMDIVFDKEVIDLATKDYVRSLINSLVILAGISVLLLVFLNNFVSITTKEGKIDRKRILAMILVLLGATQIIYGFINYSVLRRAYIDIATENTTMVSRIIQNDIESVVNKGVPYRKLYNLDDYMNNIIHVVPEIGEINIVSHDNEVLFRTSDTTVENNQIIQSSFSYQLPLIEDTENVRAFLNAELSESYLKSRMQEVILDILTILITSIFFMVEITFFMLMIFKKQLGDEDTAAEDEENQDDREVDTGIVRPLTFILFIALFMPSAFIPVMMKEIYRPILGLSETVILGLPLSSNFLFGAVATILAGRVIDRKGWKMAFLIGAVFFSVGTFLSGITNDPSIFIFARGIAGAGYGFTLMAVRGFILANPLKKTEGFSALNSGLYSGINCGVVIGAMLADRIGFSKVFYISVIVMMLAVAFALIFVPNVAAVKKSSEGDQKSQGLSIKSFLANRQVFSYFLLILIPTAICSMFLDYFFPIYAQGAGVSVSNIGRAFLLHGLCIVYLGPMLSQYTGKYFGHKRSMLIAYALVIGGTMTFALNGSLTTAFIAVVLLGIADSFGLVAQTNYFLGLKASIDFGQGQALGYYSNVKKIGQMLGPMIFGSVLVFGNKTGVGLIAAACFGALILFFFISSYKDPVEGKEEYKVKES
ncbi:Predicted arabinose efflux permease, MFS family [Natronincola peptidivorans]|uniref:Predicted arabinose efflux permease, MFS family n=1 Tax=Natronincola peptidivorans TaxID=426128 RepID=A0A1I0CFG9_9FIRM|nr:MFS transporter [Natronincola peptidivorans]SET17856.1 Predicted arabinose efflux permease, MFS family [Natronincola peptidivorans]